ncbi:MAG: PKD domain-containing protein [Flavobacteriales bacterium]
MRIINGIIHRNKSALVAVLCLLCSVVSQAQITVDKAIGCAPHTAVFGAPVGSSNHVWDFGDGFFANSAAPTHIFTSAGSYVVKYTGTGGSFQTTITVQPKPTASFTAAPTSGCIPLSVQFTDQSTGAGATAITGWQWTFGDGGSAATKNPLYNYTLLGSFNAALIVTDANGCKDDTTWVTPIITSNTPPIADFTPSVTQSCTAPLTVSFVNNSSAGKGGALSYLWDFGNGATSTLTTPAAVTYNTTGLFNVKLTVTEQNGCVASKTIPILVSKPIASFSMVNDSVCPGSFFNITNTSIGATSYSWNLGDGTTASAVNINYAYAAPGTYNVKLVASAGGCSDDTTFAIVVENVIANFTRTPTYYCDFPMKVQYTNTSVPAGVSWLWEFGDQKTSNQQNPSHDFVKPDDSQYTVYDPKFYGNKLTVTSAVGCKASVTKTDTIVPIIARLQPDVAEGCVPLTVNFSDSSRSKEAINFYHWDFGDGGSSAIKNPTHTYNATGEYKVYVDIKNTMGCADTSYPIIIRVGDVTAPDFSVSAATVCPDDIVTLTDLTPGANVDSWHYSADGNNASSCPSDSNWQWQFNSAAGPQDITLTTVFNGCYSSKTISNAITVKGPVARLNYTATCDSSYKYIFKGEISGADSWTWNFGDGQSIAASTDTTVTHYYAASGNYTVKITGTNATSGCADYVDSVIIKVRKPQAVITSDSVICKQVPYTFSGASSTDVYSACSNGYRWDWGDGSPPSLNNASSDSHTYANLGLDTIRLIVSAENGCKDTAYFNLKVYGIKAGFTMDNISRCLPFPVNFNDTTHSDTTVVKWQWTFGNGFSATTKSPSTTYINSTGAPWTVKMVVTDQLGCADSLTKIVTPILPETTWSALDFTICEGEKVTFNAAGTNIAEFKWYFGDGTPVVTTTAKSLQHAYTNAPGPYDVKLVVKDNNGCLDSLTRPAYIMVQDYPAATFTSNVDGITTLCYPKAITFYDESTAPTSTSVVKWDVGTGDAVLPNDSVKFTYGKKGTYDVQLIVQTSYGCMDTAKRSFKIVGPEADFSITDTLICIGETVGFQIKDTSDVASWEWDFGGTVVPGNPSPTHPFDFYPPGGTNNVSLTVYTAGKTCSYSAKHAVHLHDAYAKFGVLDSSLCIGEMVSVVDSSAGADSWQWVVSPSGQTFIDPVINPFLLSPAGTYTISLRISDNIFNCKDTVTKTVIVDPLPTFATKDIALCEGNSKLLSVTNNNAYDYSWTPSGTLTTPDKASTMANPLVTTVYTVTVTDTANGCKDAKTATATVYSQTLFTTDSVCVIVGETIDVGVDMGDGYTYNWSTGSTKNLACDDCPTSTIKVLEDGIYKLVIKDTLNCFESLKIYDVCALKKFSVDVPTGFSPNADGVNDLVFVEGWGIEKLIVFRIFNRWGEIVFESTDIKQGWDGIYKGQPQNMESYVYYAEVLFYNGQTGSKTGSLTIIR